MDLLDGFAGRCEPVWLPAPALHELFYGARLHAEHEREIQRVWDVAHAIAPVPFDAAAAEQAGLLEAELERDGLRPARADIQIAAVALSRGQPVVSRDPGFRVIPGLEVVGYEV